MTTKYQPTSIAGKRVVISGGTTGIGRAIAVALVAKGCEVLVFGRHKAELEDALRDMREAGPTGDGMVADQANIQDVQKVMHRVAERWGCLDYLVNNAAVGGESLMKDDPSSWDYAVRANLVGYLTCTRYAIERMCNMGGHIINIGSITAEHLNPGSEIYTATKAGIRGFSEALRKGVEKRGIKVSLIEPGLTGSDLHERPVEELEKEQEAEKMMIAEDIAACVVFCLEQPSRSNISLLQILPRVAEEAD
jgi:NADP-dependent 3-hydroxy acid dehydrogenase YdfG